MDTQCPAASLSKTEVYLGIIFGRDNKFAEE
jgi:hypothetical protein